MRTLQTLSPALSLAMPLALMGQLHSLTALLLFRETGVNPWTWLLAATANIFTIFSEVRERLLGGKLGRTGLWGVSQRSQTPLGRAKDYLQITAILVWQLSRSQDAREIEAIWVENSLVLFCERRETAMSSKATSSRIRDYVPFLYCQHFHEPLIQREYPLSRKSEVKMSWIGQVLIQSTRFMNVPLILLLTPCTFPFTSSNTNSSFAAKKPTDSHVSQLFSNSPFPPSTAARGAIGSF